MMNTIYILNIKGEEIGKEAVERSIESYILLARMIAEERDKMSQFLRIWQ